MMRMRSRSRSPTSTTTTSSSSSPSSSPPASPSRSPSPRSLSPSSQPCSPAGRRKRRRQGERESSQEEEGDEEEGGTRVHVGSLAISTCTRELHRRFGRFGEMLDLWMARTHPCFAFVVYRRRRDALHAIKRMDGEIVHSRRIRVTLARPRTKGTRSGGAFNPYLRCYQCGKMGHFSRVCRAHQWSPARLDPRFHRETKGRADPKHNVKFRQPLRRSSSGGAFYRKFKNPYV